MSSPSAGAADLPDPACPPTTDPTSTSTTDAPEPLPANPSEPTPDLEALVLSLRASLASSQTLISSQSTRLVQMGDLEASLAQLKDQLTFAQAAKEALELQLRDERGKRERAEENVELLRGQVEQARRGVMQLQKQDKERKRFSQMGGGGLMSPPLSSAGASAGLLDGAEEGRDGTPSSSLSPNDGAVAGQTSRAAKRSSMYGRRPVSASGEDLGGGAGSTSAWQSPNPESSQPRTGAGGLRELRLGGSSSSPQPQAAGSSTSPSQAYFDTPLAVPDLPGTASSVPMPTNPAASLSPKKGSPRQSQSLTFEEAQALQDQNTSLRTALAESQEARMASEHALRALREFMSSSSGTADGADSDSAATRELMKGIRLPPLPTDQEPDDVPGALGERKKAAWGFGLFRTPAAATASASGRGSAGSPTPSTAVEPPATPGSRLSGLSPPASVRSGSPLVTPGELPTEGRVEAVPAVQTPLASFVSGWTKTVSPGTPGTGTDRPQAGRKLTNFFGLGTKEAAAPVLEETDTEKELPTPSRLPTRRTAGEEDGNVVDLTFDAEQDGVRDAETPKMQQLGDAEEGQDEGQESKLQPAAEIGQDALGLIGRQEGAKEVAVEGEEAVKVDGKAGDY